MSSSETRPVPRRESPWGMPEGNHRQPKAHRCNDRAEDVIQANTHFIITLSLSGVSWEIEKGFKGFSVRKASFEGNPFKTGPGPFKLFWQCMRSKPGEEPTEPHTYLELDPPKREVKLE